MKNMYINWAITTDKWLLVNLELSRESEKYKSFIHSFSSPIV